MLIAQHNVDDSAAFEMWVQGSSDSNENVREVAATLVRQRSAKGSRWTKPYTTRTASGTGSCRRRFIVARGPNRVWSGDIVAGGTAQTACPVIVVPLDDEPPATSDRGVVGLKVTRATRPARTRAPTGFGRRFHTLSGRAAGRAFPSTDVRRDDQAHHLQPGRGQ